MSMASASSWQQANMRVAAQYHPELCRLTQEESAVGCEPAVARSGEVTVRYRDRWVHSRYDPQAEALRWACRQEFADQDTVVVLGFGLGYHVQALIRTRRFGKLLIIEPDAGLLHLAMACRDLRDIMAHPRVRFLAAMSPAEISEFLYGCPLAVMAAPVTVCAYLPLTQIHPEYYQSVRQEILDAVRAAASNVFTAQHTRKILVRNILTNAVEVVRSPGINTLFGVFSGVPAVIVSAGPSLDKNIAHAADAQGKMLLLATDTAFPILLGRGIRPDLVFTADFKEISRNHFSGVPVTDVPLVFESEASWATLAEYPGPRFAATSAKPVSAWLNRLTEGKGEMPTGMSVAHFAFHCAVRMGCDPIIFIGQDLAFSGGVTHARGTGSRQSLETVRQQAEERILCVSSELTGEQLYTNHSMYTYWRLFIRLVRESGRHCINATEGGLGIPGTQVMTFRQAIDRYATLPVNIRDRLRVPDPRPDYLAVLRGIRTLRRRLRVVERIAERLIDVLECIMTQAVSSPESPEIPRLLGLIKPLTRRQQRYENVLLLIHAELVGGILQLIREPAAVSGELKRIGPEMAADFREDRQFQENIRIGCRELAQWLQVFQREVETACGLPATAGSVPSGDRELVLIDGVPDLSQRKFI